MFLPKIKNFSYCWLCTRPRVPVWSFRKTVVRAKDAAVGGDRRRGRSGRDRMSRRPRSRWQQAAAGRGGRRATSTTKTSARTPASSSGSLSSQPGATASPATRRARPPRRQPRSSPWTESGAPATRLSSSLAVMEPACSPMNRPRQSKPETSGRRSRAGSGNGGNTLHRGSSQGRRIRYGKIWCLPSLDSAVNTLSSSPVLVAWRHAAIAAVLLCFPKYKHKEEDATPFGATAPLTHLSPSIPGPQQPFHAHARLLIPRESIVAQVGRDQGAGTPHASRSIAITGRRRGRSCMQVQWSKRPVFVWQATSLEAPRGDEGCGRR